ncbi:ArnT family glycosyltransferase [Levilinea saccharolytica]|uniref:Glycosyltransferase RgtA/B/C/D-like domain-containing protein n=1 Tax=Levilinea saccharolytica TaxID=229921 RepID=A0A0P6XKI7_9CHLR|nr:hypothetical protein [Levilinea saccharolytica]KPL80739.1 hypothetical protein ADN01_11480 [Levilinea saccharolytica]GAP17186.1 4-amino-4-deoxy-L-arabinose transferase [Levilinea saccharolytica]
MSLEPPRADVPENAEPLQVEVEIAAGERVEILVGPEPGPNSVRIRRQAARTAGRLAGLRAAWARWNVYRLPYREKALFRLGLGFCALMLLLFLPSFPVSFTAVEALPSLSAEYLLKSGLRGPEGDFLPAFFRVDGQYTLGLGAYLQFLAVFLLGKSVFLARALTALVSLAGAAALSWAWRDALHVRTWWLIPWLLAVTPAWFLHSRAAWPYALAASAFGLVLWAGMRALNGGRWAYWGALAAAGLGVYAYPPAVVPLGLLAAAVTLLAARRLPRRGLTLAVGAGLAAAMALPYVRFALAHPDEALQPLQLASFWLDPELSLGGRLEGLGAAVLSGLNPWFWFSPTQSGPLLQRMLGYAPVPLAFLPFFLLGAGRLLRGPWTAERGLAAAALLASPGAAWVTGASVGALLPAAAAGVGVTALGLGMTFDFLERYRPFNRPLLAALTAVILTASGTVMLSDAVTRGPLWFRDYGLGGLQYGARQLFPLVAEAQRATASRSLTISPQWAAQVDVLSQFFLDQPEVEVRIAGPEWGTQRIEPALGETLWVSTAAEFETLRESQLFNEPQVAARLDYPDGSPGFVLARWSYRADIEAVMAARRYALFEPVSESLTVGGQTLEITHPPLLEPLGNVFDGDVNTLTKTGGANPLVLQIHFSTPRRLSGVRLAVGAERVNLSAAVYPAAGGEALSFAVDGAQTDGNKSLTLEFPGGILAERLDLALNDVDAAEVSNVHLWEVEFLP